MVLPELVVIPIFLVVQWRITMLLLAWLRRFPAPARRTGAALLILIDGVLAAGYAFTFSELLGILRIPGKAAMWAGAGTMGYLLTATGALLIYYAVRAVRKRLDAPADRGRRRAINAVGGALVATPFAVMGYGALVQRTDFRVREISVPLAGLPPDLDGLRLLHLSDIHLSAFLSEAEFARAIDQAIELRPHLALVTGDLISSPGDPLDACIRQLARLRADAGIWACMGNHERYAGVERRAAEAGARVGIHFLRGFARQLRFGNAVLNLAGVDYQSIFHKSVYLRHAERMVAPGAFNVLLSHNPDVFPVAARQGYNLLLAGHTHGGQVTIEILDQAINPARFITPYIYGLYRAGDAAAYVTRGIGTIGVPARVGAPPEISVLHLRKA